MFAKTIIDSDAFLDMPFSAQALYFHLSMRADDDGFVNSPKAIIRQLGAKEDDLRILLAKRYILGFESGVIVIKHWKIHNIIQKDRYKETTYLEEKALLELDEKKAYTELEKGLETKCIQTVSKMDTQVSIGKDSIDKNSIKKENTKRKNFIPPSVEEVRAYCSERNNNLDAEQFVNFYSAKGWLVGKVKMVDWKAAVRTWERNDKSQEGKNNKPKFNVGETL